MLKILKLWIRNFLGAGRLPWLDHNWASPGQGHAARRLVPDQNAIMDTSPADMHCEAMMFSDRSDCAYPQCGCTPKASRTAAA